jgi:tetratricopeptide (TPR) repeat protein
MIMASKSVLSLLLLVPFLLGSATMAQSRKEKRVKRALLGDRLAYGRQAADFGLWNEAIFHWEKVVVEDPNNAQATNNLAVAYESIGAYDRAAEFYQRALDLNEDSPNIRKNLKRFRSFYRKHQRQLAREERIKAKRKAKAAEDKKKATEADDEEGSL